MYKKLEICNCRVSLDEHVEYMFRYFLIEGSKKIFINEAGVDVASFGIEITSEKFMDEQLVDTYSDSIETVSSVKDKVVNLIEYLKKYEVSPVHLVDIAGEYADEWTADFDRDAKCILESISLV
jgi:hypothetical protein